MEPETEAEPELDLPPLQAVAAVSIEDILHDARTNQRDQHQRDLHDEGEDEEGGRRDQHQLLHDDNHRSQHQDQREMHHGKEWDLRLHLHQLHR